MRSLVAAAEAARLDAATEADCALPPLLLMENAAVRLWAALASRPELAPRAGHGGEPLLVALAGGGNNGGDALAVLRQARFAGRRNLAAVLAADIFGELAALQLASLRVMGLRLVSWTGERAEAEGLIAGAALLLDGIAGTGLRGPLRGPAADLAAFAAASGRPVAALDLPSGSGDGMEAGRLVLPARLTLSIEPRKLALYVPAFREASGEILAIEGVFPADAVLHPAATLLEDGDLPGLAPHPAPSAHKGERGRLAVFAGEAGALGAAAFAVRAAQAASAGLVGLYARPGLFDRLSGDPCALGGAVVREEAALSEGLAAWDAVLAGPGWGFRAAAQGGAQAAAADAERLALLRRLLAAGLPTVLDAGALRLLPVLGAEGLAAKAPLVLTPHPGEFEALSGRPAAEVLADPAPALFEVARRHGAVVVLKGAVTWIAAPDGRLSVRDGLDPSLACAGSGDVLAGTIAGILAGEAARPARGAVPTPAADKGLDTAFRAAEAAVLAHSLAGRRARGRRGWYEAGALVEEIALVLEEASR